MPAVWIFWLVISALAAAWWVGLWFLPAQRRLMRFVYTTKQRPDALNGGFPGDDVSEAFAGDPAEWPVVTVIVPGRNEGHILEKTVGSLCAMDYPAFRVVFVDDQSTDNTAEVCGRLLARHGNLTVIHNTEGPREGWIGKTWAVHQAAGHMEAGDYLLFTDSDLEFHPQCLRQMVRLARHRRADIASLLPAMRFETFGELLGLLAAMTIINTRLSLYTCNNPRDRRALVAGGFLLVKREVYHLLGGHGAVRGQVVEDVAFGTRAKASRKRVFTALTHDLYTARMYEGWGDTFRGLKKNAYAGANYSPVFAVFIAGFLWFLGVMPVVYAGVGVWRLAVHFSFWAGVLAAMGVVGFLAEVGAAWRAARFMGVGGRAAWTIPAGFLFYFLVFVGSVVDHYRGGNFWAGRRVGKVQTLAEAGRPPS